jgi:hypothetical protein
VRGEVVEVVGEGGVGGTVGETIPMEVCGVGGELEGGGPMAAGVAGMAEGGGEVAGVGGQGVGEVAVPATAGESVGVDDAVREVQAAWAREGDGRVEAEGLGMAMSAEEVGVGVEGMVAEEGVGEFGEVGGLDVGPVGDVGDVGASQAPSGGGGILSGLLTPEAGEPASAPPPRRVRVRVQRQVVVSEDEEEEVERPQRRARGARAPEAAAQAEVLPPSTAPPRRQVRRIVRLAGTGGLVLCWGLQVLTGCLCRAWAWRRSHRL